MKILSIGKIFGLLLFVVFGYYGLNTYGYSCLKNDDGRNNNCVTFQVTECSRFTENAPGDCEFDGASYDGYIYYREQGFKDITTPLEIVLHSHQQSYEIINSSAGQSGCKIPLNAHVGDRIQVNILNNTNNCYGDGIRFSGNFFSRTALPVSEIAKKAPSVSEVHVNHYTILPPSLKRVYNDDLLNIATVGQSVISMRNSTKDLIGDNNIVQDSGDPVSLSNGRFTYQNSILSFPSIGIPFEFKISYSNQLFYDGPVGINWDYNYNIYLEEMSGGLIGLYDGGLGLSIFQGSNSYNKKSKSSISITNDGIYQVLFDSGLMYSFNSQRRISNIQDQYNNKIEFIYNNQGLLSQIIDSSNRIYNLSYYDHARLKELKDFQGDSILFEYITGNNVNGLQGDLHKVVFKKGLSGKNLAFTYTTGNTTTSHNLLKLIDAKGQTYVENTYEHDRVVKQMYGSGVLSYNYVLSGNAIVGNKVTNRNGIETHYSFDLYGNIIKREIFSPESGSTIYSYQYDKNNQLIKEILPKGNGYSYLYDSRGNVVEKRFKQRATQKNSDTDWVWSYVYSDKDLLLHQLSPGGTKISYEFDKYGKLVKQTTAGSGQKVVINNFEYNEFGQLIQSIDGRGNSTFFIYSGAYLSSISRGNGPDMIVNYFEYDHMGNIVININGRGGRTQMNYDEFSNMIQSISPGGKVMSYKYDLNNNLQQTISNGQATGDNTYDILDNMISSEQHINENVVSKGQMTYDNNGNVISVISPNGLKTTYTYNEFDKVLTETKADNKESIVVKYQYDKNGNLIKKYNALNKANTLSYDLFDRLVKSTDSLGTYTALSYDKEGNIVQKITFDKEQKVLEKTEYSYDLFNRVLLQKAYFNLTDAIETRFEYDENGNLIRQKTSGNGQVKEIIFEYDEFNRKIKQTIGSGEATIQTVYTYDKNNNLITESSHGGSSPVSQVISYSYDDDNRLIRKATGLPAGSVGGSGQGTVISYEYNTLNQLIKVVDGNDNETNYEYDFRGKTTKVVEGTEEYSSIVMYEYDLLGNLIKVIDQKGQRTLYNYDAFSRLISTLIEANTGTGLLTNYTYDKAGNIISQIDPNGTKISNTYDANGRLVKKTIKLAKGIGGTTGEWYSYDGLGRLASGSNSLGSVVVFEYDDLSRLLRERQDFEATANRQQATVEYTYDALNNITSILTPSGKLQTFEYDVLQRPTTVSYDSEVVKSYVYSGMYLIAEATANRQEATEFSYDSLGRILSLNNGIKNYAYNYDNVGNILGDGEKEYSYDDVYRLIYSTGLINSESFNYDPAGNRVAVTVIPSLPATVGNVRGSKSYTTNHLNQYTSTSGSDGRNFIYDNNGNLIDNGAYTFQYDYQNRLIKVYTGESTIAEYKYDVLGRRTSSVVSRPDQSEGYSLNTYTYSDKNIIQEIKTVGGKSFKKDYINGLGTDNLIAYDVDEVNLNFDDQQELNFCDESILSRSDKFTQYGWTNLLSRCYSLVNSGGIIVRNRYYYHKDHQGSIVGLSTSSGNIVLEYDYDTFGAPYIKVGSGYINFSTYTGNLYSNNRLYTSRELDIETDFYYYRARFYDSDLGKFISRDPIGQSDDVNVYAYVKNNPISFVDPMGTEARSKNITQSQNKFDVTELILDHFEIAYTHNKFNPITIYQQTSNGGTFDIKRNVLIKSLALQNGGEVYFNGISVEPSNVGNMLASFNIENNYIHTQALSRGFFWLVEVGNAYNQGYGDMSKEIASRDENSDSVWYDAGITIYENYSGSKQDKINVITDVIKNSTPIYQKVVQEEIFLRNSF